MSFNTYLPYSVGDDLYVVFDSEIEELKKNYNTTLTFMQLSITRSMVCRGKHDQDETYAGYKAIGDRGMEFLCCAEYYDEEQISPYSHWKLIPVGGRDYSLNNDYRTLTSTALSMSKATEIKHMYSQLSGDAQFELVRQFSTKYPRSASNLFQ